MNDECVLYYVRTVPYGTVGNELFPMGNSWKRTVPSYGTVPLSIQANVFRHCRKFLRGVEISSIFMKYRGRAVLDDFQTIMPIVVEILLRTHSQ
jgi:hypothetical protein